MKYTVSTESPDIQWGLSGEDRIVQNVLNILRTYKNEIPYMRDEGISRDFFDNTLDYIKQNITQEIIDVLKEYEQRAEVVSVSVGVPDENGNYIISVELEV